MALKGSCYCFCAFSTVTVVLPSPMSSQTADYSLGIVLLNPTASIVPPCESVVIRWWSCRYKFRREVSSLSQIWLEVHLCTQIIPDACIGAVKHNLVRLCWLDGKAGRAWFKGHRNEEVSPFFAQQLHPDFFRISQEFEDSATRIAYRELLASLAWLALTHREA